MEKKYSKSRSTRSQILLESNDFNIEEISTKVCLFFIKTLKYFLKLKNENKNSDYTE